MKAKVARSSRVTQRKKIETRGKKKTTRALTVDDFDLSIHHHGQAVDPTVAREVRLPFVIRGMRQNKSIREIAFEVGASPSTIALDKKWVLEEAWELRQDLMGLWLEEQLQQYERLLSLLDKELQVELVVKTGEGKHVKWEPKKDKDGKQVVVVNQGVLDKMLSVMDKVNELKGLKQPLIVAPIHAGDNATINLNQDADAARELLDVLKPRKMGNGKTPLVS